LEESMEELEEAMEASEEEEEEENEEDNSPKSSSLGHKHSHGHSHGPCISLYAEGNHDEKSLSKEFFQIMANLYNSQPIFRQTIKECDKEIRKLTEQKYSLIKDLASLGMESKKNMGYLGNVLVLAFHYAFNKVLKALHPVENPMYVGYGYGELATVLNAGGLTFGRAAEFLKLLTQPKDGIIFRSIKKWYKKSTPRKLKANIFILSNHREYKIEKFIPLNCWISMAKVLLNNNKLKEKYVVKGNAYIAKTFGETMQELTILSLKPELSGLIDGSITGIVEKLQMENRSHQVHITTFNGSGDVEDCMSALDTYLMENYRMGNEINWKEFHKRFLPETTKEYPLHKIELPTYPFQRSVFWPTPN